jgi:prephenate dehydrogenase
VTWQRVCIIGVGLLGGSIGLRLRRDNLANEVVGLGRDLNKLQAAVKLGAIDLAFDRFDQACEGSDLIIACTPVQQIPESIHEAARWASPNALFTDVGSTKLSIVETFESSALKNRFIGSHPIAGSDKSGVEHATAELFLERLVVVTPTDSTDRADLDVIVDFWKQLGAKIKIMSAAEHDQAVAITSHLPHILASMMAMATPEQLLEMIGTGWRDTTRIAGGNPQLWRQILEENHGPVLRALQNFATISREWMAAIEAKDFERVEQLLIAGKEIRDTVGNRYSSG